MKHMRTMLNLLVIAFLAWPAQSLAYSYASPTSDPLIKEREAYLDGVNKGDWQAVEKAYSGFKSEIDVLSRGEDAFAGDKGLTEAFTQAISKKDSAAAKAALQRAYIDQIERRLNGAGRSLKTKGSDNDAAKSLLAAARALYTAMAGDLPAGQQKVLSAEFNKALDAIGKPGLLGFGSVAPDPAKFNQATKSIISSLKGSG